MNAAYFAHIGLLIQVNKSSGLQMKILLYAPKKTKSTANFSTSVLEERILHYMSRKRGMEFMSGSKQYKPSETFKLHIRYYNKTCL